ncbi:unnamed protein product [Cuscuta epithymum]|uniref:DUF7392 domain-containing protein n=2 Tax=Cuscuta epithymum TaxID=186058 RepID=A0AAV0E0T9_9ASTE|nr:unnamed protein product [Cuscuta epithymum]
MGGESAACFVPFNDRNLDLSFFILRPTIVMVDHLLAALKQFSSSAHSLGCIHSSVFKSIHGSLIVWYGAWVKRPYNNGRELLNASLLSRLRNDVSSMAILLEHGFYDAYAGEARDGTLAAKFFTGDTISLHTISFSTCDNEDDTNIIMSDFSYACLAIFKDRFIKMGGAKAGACLKSARLSKVCAMFVWRSLQSCYSYILSDDYRTSILPYLDGFSIDIKYDIFRVVFVSDDNSSALNNQFFPPPRLMLHSKSMDKVVPDSNKIRDYDV